MSEFSDLLKKYVKRQHISNKKLADEMGINRTLLQKYLTGSRFPSSKTQVEQIAGRLMLSPDEHEQLMTCYTIEEMGKALYSQRKQIVDMISHFSYLIGTAPASRRIFNTTITPPTGSVFLQGKEAIIVSVQEVVGLEASAAEDPCTIQIIMQPEQEDMMMALKMACLSSDISVHQLICMNQEPAANKDTNSSEQRRGSKKKSAVSIGTQHNYNLQILSQIIPLLLSLDRYKASFYYGQPDTNMGSMSLWPYLIMTPHYCLLFDSKISQAIFTNDEQVHKACEARFHLIASRCFSASEEYNGFNEQMTYYFSKMPCSASLQIDPCLAFGITRDMLAELMLMNANGVEDVWVFLSQTLEEQIKTAVASGKCAHVNFFTREGMHLFLQAGRLDEYPSNIYRPVSVSNRKKLLQTFVEMIRSGILKSYLLKEDMLVDRHLIIQQLKGNEICLVCKMGAQRKTLVFKEQSLKDAFVDFFEYLPQSKFVYSLEETLAYIQECMDSLPGESDTL